MKEEVILQYLEAGVWGDTQEKSLSLKIWEVGGNNEGWWGGGGGGERHKGGI